MNDVIDPSVLRPDAPEETAALFASCAWFRALADEYQQRVLSTSHAEYRESGAWVAHRGAPSDYWISVHSGLLKLAIYNASERSCTLSGVPPGGWFGRRQCDQEGAPQIRRGDDPALARDVRAARNIPYAAVDEPVLHRFRDSSAEQPDERIHRVNPEQPF